MAYKALNRFILRQIVKCRGPVHVNFLLLRIEISIATLLFTAPNSWLENAMTDCLRISPEICRIKTVTSSSQIRLFLYRSGSPLLWILQDFRCDGEHLCLAHLPPESIYFTLAVSLIVPTKLEILSTND